MLVRLLVLVECVRGGSDALAGRKETGKRTTLDPRLCEGKDQGFFPMPDNLCSQTFYACVGNFPEAFTCPAQNAYDPRVKRCESVKVVAGCPGAVTTTLRPTAAQHKSESQNFLCQGRQTGFYPNPFRANCSSMFYACVVGREMGLPRHCPDQSLRFEPALGQCLSETNVVACGGSLPTTTTTTTTTTTRTPSITHVTTAKASLNTPPNLEQDELDEFDANPAQGQLETCSGVEESFAEPHSACSQLFFHCRPGSTAAPVLRRCPNGLYWSSGQLSGCRSRAEIPACTRRTRSEGLAKNNSPDCEGRIEGSHPSPLPCANHFFVCGPVGPAKRMECPPGLRFDREFHQCLAEKDVPECQGLQVSPTPAHFTCKGRADGNYALEELACPHIFVTCANGRSFQSSCPGRLRYFAEGNQCVHRDQVPSCQGHPIHPYR